MEGRRRVLDVEECLLHAVDQMGYLVDRLRLLESAGQAHDVEASDEGQPGRRAHDAEQRPGAALGTHSTAWTPGARRRTRASSLSAVRFRHVHRLVVDAVSG